MKVLLIKPRIYKIVRLPDLGLGYLASSLRKIGCRVSIFDWALAKKPFIMLKEIMERTRPDVIGIKLYTQELTLLKKIIEIIKVADDSVKIIAGGPHPSSDPENFMRKFSQIDFAFRGEAETGFPQLINILKERQCSIENSLMLKDIPGLIWREKEKIITNQQYFEKELDRIAFPAWDLIDPNIFPDNQRFMPPNYPSAPLLLTRGCPYNCEFCAGHFITGKKLRKRSIANVMEEIKLLHNQYKVKDFQILDENLTLDSEYVKEFCRAILKLDFQITWSLPYGISVRTVRKDMIKLMETAGCYFLALSIESGSPVILDSMNKGITVEMTKRALALLRDETNMTIGSFFMIGYPGETLSDINMTIKLAMTLDLDIVLFFLFTPHPGTAVYRKLEKENELKNLVMHKSDYDHVSYSPAGISLDKLNWLRRKAYVSFYFRPKIVSRLIRSIKTYKMFLYILKRGLVYLGIE